jgi:1-acyl-sn-glycerol-3-phosphate acyltransferase
VYSFLARRSIFFLRIFLGIRICFEDEKYLEKLKTEYPCFLLAVKHQSVIETLLFSIFFESFNTIHKKEILRVPLIGWYMKKMKFISIDRNAGQGTLQKMIQQSKESLEEKRPILIFPEGTRVPFGQRRPYRRGVAVLYKHLQIPILPVAHNAGEFFPVGKFAKKPGCITVRFLPPIYPGKSETEVLQTLENCIESACHDFTKEKKRGCFLQRY